MLCKIHKYLNFQSAVAVYKQTILPIIDYAGLLLLSCNLRNKMAVELPRNTWIK